jgi:hypothetical protein
MAESKPVVLVGGQLQELPAGDTLPPQVPAAHVHATSDVAGLDAALAGKSSTGHGHAIGDVSGLDTALNSKEPKLGFKITVSAAEPASPAEGDIWISY